MGKFNLYREDVMDLAVKLVDKLQGTFPTLTVIEGNEDVLFEQIEEVLDQYFDSPDYRNYN